MNVWCCFGMGINFTGSFCVLLDCFLCQAVVNFTSCYCMVMTYSPSGIVAEMQPVARCLLSLDSIYWYY